METLVVVLIVVAAAGFVAGRIYRQLTCRECCTAKGQGCALGACGRREDYPERDAESRPRAEAE